MILVFMVKLSRFLFYTTCDTSNLILVFEVLMLVIIGYFPNDDNDNIMNSNQ